MNALIAAVLTALVVGPTCYLLGRMVGEERGMTRAYARIEKWRRSRG